MLVKDPQKVRRLRLWNICLLMVLVSASIFLVAHVARSPSEPLISVSYGRTNLLDTIEAITIETSNRMSFDVDYVIKSEVLRSGGWTIESGNLSGTYRAKHRYSHPMLAHSKKRELLIGSQKELTVLSNPDELFTPRLVEERTILLRKYSVSYERKLKPFEVSILNKLPWLKQHYPFQRGHTSLIYDPASDSPR